MASPTVPKFPANPAIPGHPSVHEATARLWHALGDAHQAMAQAYRTGAAHLLATTNPDPDDGDDHFMTAQDVAHVLKTSQGYVYANAKKFPFTRREGRLVRFSARGLSQYLTENGQTMTAVATTKTETHRSET